MVIEARAFYVGENYSRIRETDAADFVTIRRLAMRVAVCFIPPAVLHVRFEYQQNEITLAEALLS